MALVIGQQEVHELEKTVFECFPEFADLFRKRFGSGIFEDKNYEHINPIWTDFINGQIKGRGKQYELPDWDGVFRVWMDGMAKRAGVELCYDAERWYNIDMTALARPRGKWWDGNYRIEVMFQQENDPCEVKGHVREFYDFAAPNKVLLIWTGHRMRDPKAVMNGADDVITFCAQNGIQNAGRLVIIVGHWKPTKECLEKGIEPDQSIFLTRIVP